jgi:pyruvate/2-oxoglutarate dehydrogenase complex dihydrolipoamide dehydrogenase (E3) component
VVGAGLSPVKNHNPAGSYILNVTHVAVIGAYGSAGVAVAEHLAGEVDRLTLIDDGEPGGGLCILRGCMPSKEVLSAAAHRYQARHDTRLDGPLPEVDLDAVVDRKTEHTESFAAHRRAAVHDMAEREGVEFVHDTARFVDNHTVAVGDREMEADYVVIATGSSLNAPDIPGIRGVDHMSSADVLDARDLPDSGIVVGFGYVGVELTPYIAEAGGTDLTVIEHDARPIDEADPAFGDELLDIYREEFDIEVLTETREKRLEPTDDGGVRLHTDREDDAATVEAEELFLFTGRRPNLDGLGLDNTALDPGSGWVETTMQARDDPRTFVVGDVNGHEPILHVAKEQGQIAAENILAHERGKSLRSYENVHHHVMFAGLGVYPYARVGLSEAAAREQGIDYVTATRDADDDGVFKTKDVASGLAKLLVDAENGTVLGYQGLHYHADTMAKTMQIVVENEMGVHEVPDRAYHPTLPEIIDGLLRAAGDRL